MVVYGSQAVAATKSRTPRPFSVANPTSQNISRSLESLLNQVFESYHSLLDICSCVRMGNVSCQYLYLQRASQSAHQSAHSTLRSGNGVIPLETKFDVKHTSIRADSNEPA